VRRGPALFFIIVLLFASAYGAQRALLTGWNLLADYSPPYFRSARPDTGPTPLAHRLVLIAVDGLEPDDVTRLPSLDWIRRQGASYRLTVPLPAAPDAAAATLLTGAPPDLHGYLFPAIHHTLQVDSLPEAAARVQRSFGGFGAGSLRSLTGGSWPVPAASEDLVKAARAFMAPTGPQLAVIQMQMPTPPAGAAENAPPDPELSLAMLDSLLVQILDQLDLETTAVMVVGLPDARDAAAPLKSSDVPLVMAGAGIRKGIWGNASLMDVAPTAAALLGVPTPVLCQGEPLLSALTAEGRPADVIIRQYLAARRSFANSVLQALFSTVELPEPPDSQAEADSYLQLVSSSLRDARVGFWKALAPKRLPYLGGALLVLLLYLAVVLTRRFGGPAFLSILTYLAGFHLLLLPTGGGYLGTVAGITEITTISLLLQGLKVALPMALGCLVNGFLLSRQRVRRKNFVGAASLHTALATAAVTAIPAIILLAVAGWEFPAGLPAPGLVAWFLAAAFQVVVIGYLSPLWLVLTVSAARLSLRLWPLPEIGDPVRNADNIIRLKNVRRHARTGR